MPATSETKFLQVLRKQVRAARVGFLLGAGSSYLNGAGYPLSGHLWGEIAGRVAASDRQLLEQIMVGSGCTLEEALDRLDTNPGVPFPLRDQIAEATAAAFRECSPTLDEHRRFVRGLNSRPEYQVSVVSLNYDTLVECAAAEERVYCSDGFCGGPRALFSPPSFSYFVSTPDVSRGWPVIRRVHGTLRLVKLHGSLGWFQMPDRSIRRFDPDCLPPPGARRVMIPPGWRKCQETAIPSYSDLWSDFRGLIGNDARRLVNRLVCVGYGFRDEHVNAIIRTALGRPSFTLVILARALEDSVYETWCRDPRVIIATENRCSLYGTDVSAVRDVWSFEWLAQEVSHNA